MSVYDDPLVRTYTDLNVVKEHTVVGAVRMMGEFYAQYVVNLKMAFEVLSRSDTFKGDQVSIEIQGLEDCFNSIKSMMIYTSYLISREQPEPLFTRDEYLDRTDDPFAKNWIAVDADIVPIFEELTNTVYEAIKPPDRYFLHLKEQTELMSKPIRTDRQDSGSLGELVDGGLLVIEKIRLGLETAERYLVYLAEQSSPE